MLTEASLNLPYVNINCVSGELIQKHTYLCEDAIRNNDSQKMVDNTSAIAR